jgi:hypothetical protein
VRLYLVRHAKAAPGEPDELRPLTQEGREQARALGERLRGEDASPAVVLTSPLLRARETGGELARALDVESEPDERLAPGASDDDVRAAIEAKATRSSSSATSRLRSAALTATAPLSRRQPRRPRNRLVLAPRASPPSQRTSRAKGDELKPYPKRDVRVDATFRHSVRLLRLPEALQDRSKICSCVRSCDHLVREKV